MNEKLKEIIGKHKPKIDEEVKIFKARTLIKYINEEELLEIFKLIIDDYESETEASPDDESDNTTDDPTSLKPDDIEFDGISATTQRMHMLIEDLMSTIIQLINYNAITDELSIVFKTYNCEKYASLCNRIKHIMYENNNDPNIQHCIKVLIKVVPIKYKVRISEVKYYIEADAHCIYMRFDKCR